MGKRMRGTKGAGVDACKKNTLNNTYTGLSEKKRNISLNMTKLLQQKYRRDTADCTKQRS